MHYHYRISALALCLLIALGVAAKPRSKQQMEAIAVKALTTQTQTGAKRAPGHAVIKELRRETAVAVMGFENGGFAVVSTDDLLPEVLGSSSTNYGDDRNTNFEWWLQAVNKAAADIVASGKAYASIKPNTDKYPARVDNMVDAKWGQDAPYNNLCPTDYKGEHALTGCVATAMAQILYFHQHPVKGVGERTIYFPYHDERGKPVTANYSATNYDWENMRAVYNTRTNDYTEAEADAVATLMMHCGVASDMNYGTQSSALGGSGAYSSEAAYGLRKYFGIKTARHLQRAYYRDYPELWMDIIFDEISSRRPILYGAVDPSIGGHAFVFSGYNSEGKVYVNWGWEGDKDGYYEVDLLDPGQFKFTAGQDMIVGISARGAVSEAEAQDGDLLSLDITLTEAGTLKSKLPQDRLSRIHTLKVSGPMNGADFKVLRSLAGYDLATPNNNSLSRLDLTDASIVEGGGRYIDASDQGFTYMTRNDEFPERVFYSCRSLNALLLPKSIKTIGRGAWAYCSALEETAVTNGDDKGYKFDDDVFYSADGKQLITVMPYKTTPLKVTEGVEEICSDAAAGAMKLSDVTLPSTLKTIDGDAFAGCYYVISLRSYTKTPPTLLDKDVLAYIQKPYCKLYVPVRSREAYLAAAQWKDFVGESEGGSYDNIVQFGTYIKAKSPKREYGRANPKMGYTIEGDVPKGEPVVSCTADAKSPVGTYTITVERGTVEGEIFESDNGTLTVLPATLTVTAENVTRAVDEPNPEFTVTYKGFRNDEDESVLTVKPTVTTEATNDSPVGEYVLTVSGGEAQNYKFKYVAGTLTVTVPESIDAIKTAGLNNEKAYTLDGRLVANKAGDLKQLPKGIYIIGGKKIIVK